MINRQHREIGKCAECGSNGPFYASCLTTCKPCYNARGAEARRRFNLRVQPLTHEQKVRLAIQAGCQTRESIRKHARLTMDVVCDVLADLYDRENFVLKEAA